jgi:hypothetical protein
MATPTQQAQAADLIRAAANVPAAVRQTIARLALKSQKNIEHWPYYSRVRFQTTIVVGPPQTFAFTLKQQSLGFSYGLGQDMGPAGFAGTLATIADTNIVEQSKTKDGAKLAIYGVSAYIMPLSDPTLCAALYALASCAFVRQGGDTQKKIGPLVFIPSPGGLYGQGVSYATQPNKSANHTPYGFISNGLPVSGNFYRLPEEVTWSPSGETDSTLQLAITMERAFVTPNLTPRVIGAATDFQDLFAPPAAAGLPYTFVDLMMLLLSRQTQDRSANQ